MLTIVQLNTCSDHGTPDRFTDGDEVVSRIDELEEWPALALHVEDPRCGCGGDQYLCWWDDVEQLSAVLTKLEDA